MSAPLSPSPTVTLYERTYNAPDRRFEVRVWHPPLAGRDFGRGSSTYFRSAKTARAAGREFAAGYGVELSDRAPEAGR